MNKNQVVLEPTIELETASPMEAESFVGQETENEGKNQNQTPDLSDDAQKVYETTQKFLASNINSPELPSVKFNKKMSLDEKLAQLANSEEKYQIKNADYESKVNKELKSNIEPKIEAIYQKAIAEAENFKVAGKALDERLAKLNEHRDKATESWKKNFIKEKDYVALLNEIAKEETELNEQKSYHELLKEEVKNDKTSDYQAEMIQFGNYILKIREADDNAKIRNEKIEAIQNKIKSVKSIYSYEDKSERTHLGLNDIIDEAKAAGLVRDKEIRYRKNKDGNWEQLENPFTVLVAVISEAKFLINEFSEKRKEIKVKDEEYRVIRKQIEEKEKEGWIRYGSFGAVNVTKIRKNGTFTWLVETFGDTGDFKAGYHDRLPGWLFRVVTSKIDKDDDRTGSALKKN